MNKKNLIPYIRIHDRSDHALSQAQSFADRGADALLILDCSADDTGHDEVIGEIKEIYRKVDLPVIAGGNIKRLEDVKKLLYAGCDKALLELSNEAHRGLLPEASKRFGKEKIAVSADDLESLQKHRADIQEYASLVVYYGSEDAAAVERNMAAPWIIFMTIDVEGAIPAYLKQSGLTGVSSVSLSRDTVDYMQLKEEFRAGGYSMNVMESAIAWEEFRLNGDGLIPVVVQDYRTDQVLMLAYMNEEAFQMTLRTGKMTYWSRSRKELWVKGLTSGHFQYVRSLSADCDKDTILARVSQVGAACHTGEISCFFNELVKKQYDETNPRKVFEDVYGVIMDRKEHPKEGSYTNYLFDKGIDKILKKVGEEATEIIIAAKNPDPEEIKYEISDFLYHVMVLMAERGVTWDDIMRELARR
ncbi:bifunctional phosphoribosyl-AMP cyclohydrolase/phosphoribosyl-ATP diphosphatase HisIE [Diplocloster agilis]|uniref:Histidine biosynthesis bifunctional protein HisIE n=1 Tax=Diplocloster agilis TaxID=2850323 RepID=A0A949K4F5_9FIRM|nr:bifunctional phosphoribosyl-AMP cyclohydrolase/phosphoribosyl-ATP diphosphatase HisIE [Diplocloster agilis]MBU9735313.1 bifunctional phosphoribosyl-AMP cyclohydrolase/phosphoribosyl-ATP diphosphatase HisIE [Diplocloster agilis]MBU9743355.1 bifunctional phosphoribosyl-AMP cyclohydrolase/phosphoribosyl-ATP diphosphatase HisIE [Diplocloster agilis]